jgi:hypothetical protein
MSDSVGRDLAIILRNAGLTPVFVGQFPATPDELVTIRSTGGVGPLETHDGACYERPRVQVIVRAKDEATAAARVRIAYRALRKIRNAIINGTYYLAVKAIDGIADLGTDEQNPPRRLMTFNAQVTRAED